MSLWADIHCHLSMLDVPVEEALATARAARVGCFINIGTNPDDWEAVQSAAKRYPQEVFYTWGVHPHDATLWSAAVAERLKGELQDPQLVAVGEIGLDYFYQHSPREVQMKAFREQLQIACSHNLPVEIHTRDAEEDTIAILKEFQGALSGVIHCFTGTRWLADEALALGLDLSFSGVITFKTAQALREVCASVPKNRMHIETDAPFLAPVPMRGKKNQPGFVSHTAKVVAEVKAVSESELQFQLNSNLKRTFPRITL